MRDWLQQQPLLQRVVTILQAQQSEAYLVGGAVRDLLLGRDQVVDLDFAVPGDGLVVARRVANALGAAFYPLDAERGTGRVVYEQATGEIPVKTYLDFATFRGQTLAQDLADRDFTINAMALSLAEAPELIDPLHGQADLAAGRIRAASPAAFQNDPVRVLRAARQATEFGFSLAVETETLIRQAAPGLDNVSAERKRDELVKLLNTPAPGQAVRLLNKLAVLPHFLPEVVAMTGVAQSPPHYLDVFEHTAEALNVWAGLKESGLPGLPAHLREAVRDYLAERLAGEFSLAQALPLALLLHDTGKPLARTVETGQNLSIRVRFFGHEQKSAELARIVLDRFRFSTQAAGFVETVVAQHMRPLALVHSGLSRRVIYRFFRDTGRQGYQAGVAVALHALADHRATYPAGAGQAGEEALLAVIYQLLEAYFSQREQVVEPPPLLSGRDLIEQFNLHEGRLIGRLLNRLKEAQAVGQVSNRQEALAFVEAELQN